MMFMSKPDRMLTPAQVAAMCAVDPRTVSRWAKTGLLPCARTPGGHRRFRESVIRAMLREGVEGESDR